MLYSIADLDKTFAIYSKCDGRTESVSREEWVVRNQEPISVEVRMEAWIIRYEKT